MSRIGFGLLIARVAFILLSILMLSSLIYTDLFKDEDDVNMLSNEMKETLKTVEGSVEYKIDIMRKYIDGGSLQFRERSDTNITWKDWDCMYSPEWNWATYEYRIKPVNPARDYQTVGEMINDFCERYEYNGGGTYLPPIWIRNKRSGKRYFLTEIPSDEQDWIVINGDVYALSTVFNEFTYIDGMPFGVIKEL